MTPALARGAHRAAGELHHRLRRSLRLFELALLLLHSICELLDARVGHDVGRNRRSIIGIDLLDAVAASIAPLGRAGGMIAFLRRSDYAIELERVAWRRGFASDAAGIGVIVVFSGDAEDCVTGKGLRYGASHKSRGKCGKPTLCRVTMPTHYAA